MSRQNPLPGLEGQVRFGRTAAAQTPANLPASFPGRLSLSWEVRVNPEAVLCHLWIPGEPQAKQRPIVPRAKLLEDGTVRQPHAFTPKETVDAERRLGWILKTARTQGPVAGPVGLRAVFWTSGRRLTDWDNLGKLLSDSAGSKKTGGILYEDDAQVLFAQIEVHRGISRPGTDLLVWRL